jgi:hypothetical protein
VFQALGLLRIIKGVPDQEVPNLLDFLEPGDIWEIMAQGYRKKV